MAIPEQFLPKVSSFEFPYLASDHEYRCISVALRGRVGDDRWAILDSPHCYNRVTETWEYEMRPSERDEEWMAQTRMPLEEALALADKLAVERNRQALEQITRMLERRRENYEQALGAAQKKPEAEQDAPYIASLERHYAEATTHYEGWLKEREELRMEVTA